MVRRITLVKHPAFNSSRSQKLQVYHSTVGQLRQRFNSPGFLQAGEFLYKEVALFCQLTLRSSGTPVNSGYRKSSQVRCSAPHLNSVRECTEIARNRLSAYCYQLFLARRDHSGCGCYEHWGPERRMEICDLEARIYRAIVQLPDSERTHYSCESVEWVMKRFPKCG